MLVKPCDISIDDGKVGFIVASDQSSLSPCSHDIVVFLPDTYSGLTIDNFIVKPKIQYKTDVGELPNDILAGYDARIGILICKPSYLYHHGHLFYSIYDVYCFY